MQDKSLLDRLRDWDWDLAPLWAAFMDTVGFHMQEHGWIAIVIITLLVITILLMTDATSYITELVLASGVRAIFSAVTMVLLAAMAFLGISTGRMAIAKLRNALGISSEPFRKKDPRR